MDAGWVAAIATVVYTLLTALIWHATWQNTKATRQLLEASNRPYVGVTRIDSHAVNQGALEMQVRIQNVGSAPCRNLKVKFQIQVNGATNKIHAVGEELALLPGQEYALAVPMGLNEVVFHPVPTVVASAEMDYDGMSDKHYQTKASYRFTQVGRPFFLLSTSLE